jgi:hypothetical protein
MLQATSLPEPFIRKKAQAKRFGCTRVLTNSQTADPFAAMRNGGNYAGDILHHLVEPQLAMPIDLERECMSSFSG